jgi:hypothetical protein
MDGDADCFKRIRVGDVEAGKGDGLVDEDGYTSACLSALFLLITL